MIQIICKLRTPQDNRFEASGILSLQYIAKESDKQIVADARDIVRRGHKAVEEMLDEEIVSGFVPENCFVPEGFDVTVNFADGRTQSVDY